jgi:hypothetical protein
MPGYIKKQLLKYKHTGRRIQYCPCSLELRKYGAGEQFPVPIDDLQKLTKNKIKKVKKNVESILYYAWTLDLMVLMVLSTIASEQTKGMENTVEKAYKVLDYLATHLNAKVRFGAFNMVMNFHSDVSYLT